MAWTVVLVVAMHFLVPSNAIISMLTCSSLEARTAQQGQEAGRGPGPVSGLMFLPDILDDQIIDIQ